MLQNENVGNVRLANMSINQGKSCFEWVSKRSYVRRYIGFKETKRTQRWEPIA